MTELQKAYFHKSIDVNFIDSLRPYGYFEYQSEYLDLKRLNIVWNKLIDRHQVLGCKLDSNGNLYSDITMEPFVIKFVDLRGFTREEQDREVVNLRIEKNKFGPQNSLGYLFEVIVMRTSLFDVVAFVKNIIICDGLSNHLLYKELVTMYKNLDCNFLPIHYNFNNYLIDYENLKRTQRYLLDEAYFGKKIENFDPQLQCCINNSKLYNINNRMLRRQIEIAPENVKQILAICRNQKLTLNSFLLSLYAFAINSIFSLNKIYILMVYSKRFPLNTDVHKLVSNFNELALLEIDYKSDKPLYEHAQLIQKETFMNLSHNSYSGLDVINNIRLTHNFNGEPITSFAYSSVILEMNKSGDFQKQPVDFERRIFLDTIQIPHNYIELQIFQHRSGLLLAFDYLEDYYNEEVMNKLVSKINNKLNFLTLN